MKDLRIVFLSLTLLLAACSDPPPVDRTIKVLKVTDSAGQEHIIKEPEVDYTVYSFGGHYRTGDIETGGMRTVGQLLPWSDILCVQIGKADTRDTSNIPGDVPGHSIKDLWHAEVQLRGGTAKNVVLLDTSDGWLQGDGVQGLTYIKLGDVKTLVMLPDERTMAKISAHGGLPQQTTLHITPDEGAPYDTLESFRYSMEKTHFRIISNVEEPGLKVYLGKSVVALPWATLKQVEISKKSQFTLERTADITFADGQRRHYQLYEPADFHLQASSNTLAGMKTIVVNMTEGQKSYQRNND